MISVRKSWNYLTVYKQMSSGLFRIMPTNYLFTNHIFSWLFGFYGISIFVGYLMPNPFLYK